MPTEVFALRYATMHGRRASEVFYRYDLYGEDDRVLDMDCYFWVIRDASGVTLLDCGWHRDGGLPSGGRYAHVKVEQTNPVDLLARLGMEPGDIDNVIVSHMHFDHVGNLDLFPEANLIIARAEYECWTGAYGRYPALAHSTRPEDIRAVQGYEKRRRLHLVDAREEVLPGVVTTPIGGHTPGQLIVEVATANGSIVLASDAVHYHEELTAKRPFYIFTDLIGVIDSYELLRAKSASAGTVVVSGHDPIEMSRFQHVNDACVDLTKPA